MYNTLGCPVVCSIDWILICRHSCSLRTSGSVLSTWGSSPTWCTMRLAGVLSSLPDSLFSKFHCKSSWPESLLNLGARKRSFVKGKGVMEKEENK